MEYALLIYENDAHIKAQTDPSQRASSHAAYMAYTKALREAGIMRGGAGLQAATTATTLSQVNGKQHVQDGPFADTKEKLAGFYLIEVADLDKALEWAARCPAVSSGGKIEVRPLLSM